MTRGWGTLFGTIADWLPGRKESLRNQRDKIMREMDAILQKPFTRKSSARYGKLADKLLKIENRLANA